MKLATVALPVPLRQEFDYLLPDSLAKTLLPGTRVRVPFRSRQLIGIVVGISPVTATRQPLALRPIESVLDENAVVPPPLLTLCQWTSRYYHHALGEVLAAALPNLLRNGSPLPCTEPEVCYYLTDAGRVALDSLPSRATALRSLLRQLADGPTDRTKLRSFGTQATIRRARSRGWIGSCPQSAPAISDDPCPNKNWPQLTESQQQALQQLRMAAESGRVSLLDGITGSGKTELYLRMSKQAIAAGQQVLALAPEIGLTPHLADCFARRFPGRVACYHSGMGHVERARAWASARSGTVDVIVGARSAIFVPLARPGLIIVDEEHDVSYKQQDGLRYSARDLAIVRGRLERVPVILGSATPSLESLNNAKTGRYQRIRLRHRIGAAGSPRLTLLDVRGLPLRNGLSEPLLRGIDRHLAAGGQTLLFINRRGFAPVLLCARCGWVAPCRNCNARLTLHRHNDRLICHHCGYQELPPTKCPGCGQQPLHAVGQGTERVEETLRMRFPGRRIERIDSDRTRSARVLASLLEGARTGKIDILVGTQILAKGHDFAGLTLVGLVDMDQALYGSDFRALERMGQMVTQVAGRAGRADRPGEVIIQTFNPQHPHLRRLVADGYEALAEDLITERQVYGFPPSTHLALLRAEARKEGMAMKFLEQVSQLVTGDDATAIAVLGPAPALMERRNGLYRAQLVLRASRRVQLHAALQRLLPKVGGLRVHADLRWSLDVDPADLF